MLLHAALPLFVGMVSVFAQSAGGAASTEILNDLAPGGKLRAAINLGNSVLAQTDVASGQPKGITPDIARELGHRLGVPVEFVIFDAAGKVFEATRSGVWDIAFVAIDPVRAAEIEFTAPYVLIEGTYMVPADSPLKTISDVDRPGVRVAVGLGSAYDLYLTRTIKYATIVRATAGGGHEMIDLFIKDKLEAAAGAPTAGHLRGNQSERAGDGRPLYGNSTGYGHAQGPYCRGALSGRIRRGNEGLRLCRCGA
jgi:polar amino acid transport system substrate-binding protein